MKLYVGNLSFSSTENDLTHLFSQFGQVVNTSVMMDRFSGRSRGFGFVTMSSESEGEDAIRALAGNDFQGRNLTVNEARPMSDDGGRRFAPGRGAAACAQTESRPGADAAPFGGLSWRSEESEPTWAAGGAAAAGGGVAGGCGKKNPAGSRPCHVPCARSEAGGVTGAATDVGRDR